jgi:hypothetical protein
MTEDHKAMIVELERVSDLLAQPVSDMEQDDGNIRFFSAAFLTAAVQLHVEIGGHLVCTMVHQPPKMLHDARTAVCGGCIAMPEG